MTRARLFSSDQIIRALERAGFEKARSRGRHAAFKKEKPDGTGHYVTIVPLNRPQVPRGTFESILEQAHLTYDEFLKLARARTRGDSSA